MISTIVSRLVILVFGTLYPAYASYKAVRTKNVKEYVKWMMYWIVFALFTCAETITDVFLSWFPFYYEIKIVLVLWLLSPATKGSSILYRKFVHPMLSQREQEIDEYLAKAKEQGYHTVLNLGSKGVTYATNVIMQTAIKGGGGIVNQLKKSYSLSDLSDDSSPHIQQSMDVVDQEPRRRSRRSPHRSHSERNSKVDIYFPEMDIRPDVDLSHVRSTDDISSGYSSAEPLYGQTIVPAVAKIEPREGLVRTASVGGASRSRTRTTRATVAKKVSIPEDSELEESSGSDSEIIPQKINSLSTKNVIKKSKDYSDESDSDADDFVDTIDSAEKTIPTKTIDVLTIDLSNEQITKDSYETNEEKHLVAKETKVIPTEENVKQLTEHVITEHLPKICQKINHPNEEPNPSENNLKEHLNNVIKTLENNEPQTTKDIHITETQKEPTQSKKDHEDDFRNNIKPKETLQPKLDQNKILTNTKLGSLEPKSGLFEASTKDKSKLEAPRDHEDAFLNNIKQNEALPTHLDQNKSEKAKLVSKGPQTDASQIQGDVRHEVKDPNFEGDKPPMVLQAKNTSVLEKELVGTKQKFPTLVREENLVLANNVTQISSLVYGEDHSGFIKEEVGQKLNEKHVLDHEINWVKDEMRSIEVDFAKEETGATVIDEKVVEDEFYEANMEENDNDEDDYMDMENRYQEDQKIKNLRSGIQYQEPFQSKSVEDLPSKNLDTNLDVRERPKSSLDYKVFDSLLHGEVSNDVKDGKVKEEKIKIEKSSGFFSRGGKYNKLTAPEPPNFLECSHPIKATLVLKPGVIKSIPTTAENKTIFMHKSPKIKRKSQYKTKDNSTISKLMMLPKKLWGASNIDGESSNSHNSNKRSSFSDSENENPKYFRRMRNDDEESD